MQKLLLVYYHSENRATSQIWKILPNMFFSRFGGGGGGNGGVLSMRMQVILDSLFVPQGSAPIWGGKKRELRDWTTLGIRSIGNYGFGLWLIPAADPNFLPLRIGSTLGLVFVPPPTIFRKGHAGHFMPVGNIFIVYWFQHCYIN